ncbi:hypothetical protein LCGC14_0569840 [marine sediment metagenome]|uniref:Uncharacterized protein n=1 Tax=marine sediment metagenome TaxID=412755 RepID=A0A0F9S353_9ZZZZ
MKKELRYKNPINLFVGVILFIVSFCFLMFWWYLVIAIISSFKLAQSQLVISEDDNIVRKQGNEWIEKLKFKLT